MRPSSRTRPEGTTLVELVIACGVLGLVMVGLTQIFLLSYDYHQALTLSGEVQDTSLVAVSALTQELAEGNAGSLRIDDTPPGIIFGSPRASDGSVTRDAEGRIQWQKLVCFYLDERGLVRKEEMLPSPSPDPPPVTPDKNSAYFVASNLQAEVVARNVSEFEVGGTNPVNLRLVVERVVNDELYRADAQLSVGLRNR